MHASMSTSICSVKSGIVALDSAIRRAIVCWVRESSTTSCSGPWRSPHPRGRGGARRRALTGRGLGAGRARQSGRARPPARSVPPGRCLSPRPGRRRSRARYAWPAARRGPARPVPAPGPDPTPAAGLRAGGVAAPEPPPSSAARSRAPSLVAPPGRSRLDVPAGASGVPTCAMTSPTASVSPSAATARAPRRGRTRRSWSPCRSRSRRAPRRGRPCHRRA